MWHHQDEDVQVIELSNEIELLPNDSNGKPFLKEEICKDMLSKVKENVNYLHLQTVKSKIGGNQPEVDLEFKVTDESLTNGQRKGNYKIENVEILKKVKQENEDEIQDSVIKIQNSNLRRVRGDSGQHSTESSDDQNDRFDMNSLNQSLGCLYNRQPSSNDVDAKIDSNDVHPVNLHEHFNPNSADEKVKRQLLKKYLQESAVESHMRPVVKIDMNKRFEDDEIYPICSKPRGYCIIINNVDFKIHEQRKGSDLEAEYLKEIFKQLNFEVQIFRNQTSIAMLDTFKNIVKRPELEYHDTFITIILTHGDDSKALIGVDASILKVDSLLHYFTDANCPHLANKPKLFFIQACRGVNHDFGVYDQTTVSDAAAMRVSNTKNARKQIKDLNRLNDVLVVNSTLDGFVSLRNEISGSWFGHALSLALCEHSKEMELQNLLSFVNRKILEREKGDVQQAIECNYIGMRKRFYFNPGHIFEKRKK